MGRFSGNNSHGFRVQDLGGGFYRLHWIVDRYYRRSRLRHPTSYSRDTDREGARRFAKRHGLEWRE